MKDALQKKNCIIYCRVSTHKQAQQNESLDDQEKICRAVAERQDLNVLKVFKEQFSGRKEARPAIDEAFEYIKNNPKKVQVFIFRVIDRFTRNGVVGYEQLKQRLLEKGVQPVDSYGIIQPSTNTLGHLGVEYSWSKISPSETAELVMAQEGKNEVNRILTRMFESEINLVRDGYHIGQANDGYVLDKIFVGSKKRPIQKPDPHRAHFIIKMFEMRASSGFTDEEIVDQVNSMGYTSKVKNKWSAKHHKIIGVSGGKKLTVQQLQKFITNPIYCAVKMGRWVKKPIRTKYAGLVDISTFNKANKNKIFIEELRNGEIVLHRDYNSHSLKRLKDNPLFPFKSVILCPICEKPFLGSVSKGKYGEGFPFYHCARGHKQFGVNKKKLEETLAYFINNLKYKEGFLKSFEATLINKYREREKEIGEFSLKASENVADLEKEKLQKIEAFTHTHNSTIQETLDKQITEIQAQIIKAQEQRNKFEIKENDVHSFVGYVKFLMEHPQEMLFKQKDFTILRTLFGLVFDKLPTYNEILNGTPKLSLPYKLSEEFKDHKSFTAGDEVLGWNTLENMIINWNRVFQGFGLDREVLKTSYFA